MPDEAQDAFASQFDRLVRASGLQAKTVVSNVNRYRKTEALWKLTPSAVSAWRNGRNLPSGANEEGFFRAVRLLTERARGRAVRGQDVGELLDEADWAGLLQRARAEDTSEYEEITAYLQALIRWLNTDPWPTDMRFGGPALTPARMELRRWVETSLSDERNCDADELADRLTRMVLGGEPGMGKTWFARRSARRCAETALSRLAVGDPLDDIELPLYTTCVRLAGMPQGDEIRRAVIRSALSHLPDLGGARISTAVRSVFQDRNAPTLLVLDSLDEASGADARIRQVDTLPPSWRVLLTTRPAAWNNQISIPEGASDKALAELRPLSYPVDVEAFITTWFAQEPDRATDLIDQFRGHQELQESAKVPLILAFYCILGTTERLPARRSDLYTKVINRMLTGRWRDSGYSEPDLQACRATLGVWAWTAAERGRNPVSGVGGWADEFPTPPIKDEADREALSHVSPPIAPTDPDTGMTMRCFIHRSIHEHLVAEYFALLPVPEAVDEMLNHLWWEATWRVPGAAAVIQHPKRDELLTELIARLTGHGPSAGQLAALDSNYEVRLFLAEVARGSSEIDWSPKNAQLIAQARAGIAGSWHSKYLSLTTDDWPNADLETRRAILAKLADAAAHSNERPVYELENTVVAAAHALSQLKPSAAEAEEARHILLGQFVRYAQNPDGLNLGYVTGLAQAVTDLHPTEDERALLRRHLRTWLALPNHLSTKVDDVPEALHALEETSGETLGILLAETQRLIHNRRYSNIPQVAGYAIQFCRGEADRAALRTALLGCIAATLRLPTVVQFADKVASLEPTTSDRAEMLDAVLAAYEREGVSDQFYISGLHRDQLKGILSQLAVTQRERDDLHERLIRGMASSNPRVALELVEVASTFAGTDAQRRRLLDAVLDYLPKVDQYYNAVEFAALIKDEVLSPQESALILSALLAAFQSTIERGLSYFYFDEIATFVRTEQEQVRAREVLLGLITPEMRLTIVAYIVKAVVAVGITDDDRAYLRQMMLERLEAEANPHEIHSLMQIIGYLGPEGEILERAQARYHHMALQWLADDSKESFHESVLRILKLVGATEEQRNALRDLLLKRTAESTNLRSFQGFLPSLVDLSRTAAERAEARAAIVKRLRTENDSFIARKSIDVLAKLNPTADDLHDSRQWLFTPTVPLLAAVRSNTPVLDWIAFLQESAKPEGTD